MNEMNCFIIFERVSVMGLKEENLFFIADFWGKRVGSEGVGNFSFLSLLTVYAEQRSTILFVNFSKNRGGTLFSLNKNGKKSLATVRMQAKVEVSRSCLNFLLH